MKIWIMPSSSFVSGRLMEPILLSQELKRKKRELSKMEDKLRELPRQIRNKRADVQQLQRKLDSFEKYTPNN